MEPIVGGWLKKSPPDKRIWRAKWRRRWFVLRSSGEIPGQYMLEYFTDQSCRKLKGRIDLDQCEQVDVGVALDTVVHRKYTYEHVFDIRTPKRIYYLVADREIEMNKWVDSICSVCGLQMHVEDDVDGPPALPTPQSVIVERQPSPTPSSLTDGGGVAALTRGESCSQSSLSTCYAASSSPYIPISECISGGSPTAINGLLPRNNSNVYQLNDLRDALPDDIPPPPPVKGLSRTKKLSDEFYDYPRPLHPTERTPLKSEDVLPDIEDPCNAVVPPPKVNWATYPRHESESTALYENRRPEDDVYDHPVVSWVDAVESSPSVEPIRSHQPPPRPPKPPPAHLFETLKQGNSKNSNNYDNIANIATLYDVPPSAQGMLTKTPSSSAFANAKDSSQIDLHLGIDDLYDFPRSHQTELSATPPAPTTQRLWQRRHIYGNAPSSIVVDDGTQDAQEYLPMDPQTIQQQQHQMLQRRESEVYTDMSGADSRSLSNFSVYSNVPSPTQRNDSGNTFPLDAPPAVNRDLKPRPPPPPAKPQSMKAGGRDHVSNHNTDDHVSLLPSPLGAAPAVDRMLKPKIAFGGVEGCDGVNIPTAITLSPAPNSSLLNPPKGKRSFRKQRASPCPSPTVSSNTLNSNGMLFPSGGSSTRLTDRSSSDDDQSSACSSRRNSSNDDHHASTNTKPSHRKSPSPSTFIYGRPGREPEIQYLDLDLELDGSAPAQSPKSPEKQATGQHHNTVYKTVDFVRTKAFNDMRQNVEETYRKS